MSEGRGAEAAPTDPEQTMNAKIAAKNAARIASATAGLESAKAKYGEALVMGQPLHISEKLRQKVWIANDRLERAMTA